MPTMNTTRRQLLKAATASSITASLAWPAFAQALAWPSRPIRLVTGAAGGVTDIRARWIAERLSPALGQPVLVENNGAAGGNIGAEQVARSAPDGHTLLMLHQGTAAINPHLYTKLGYDPLTDFAPITRFGRGSLLLSVYPSVPVNSLSELLALAKAKPGTLACGSPGNGTPPHLAGELFKRAAAIEMIHVPFKGGAEMVSALLGGHIPCGIDGFASQLPHLRAGTIRGLAVTGARRTAALPLVPTIAESGVPGYEFEGWTGIAAPAATPKAIVERLHAEIVKACASDEAQKWFEQAGAEAGTMAPAAFAELIRQEHTRLGKLIRDAGIRAG
jgi:tripartite-type tricarboxylate transporter receptor subunit TctC